MQQNQTHLQQQQQPEQRREFHSTSGTRYPTPTQPVHSQQSPVEIAAQYSKSQQSYKSSSNNNNSNSSNSNNNYSNNNANKIIAAPKVSYMPTSRMPASFDPAVLLSQHYQRIFRINKSPENHIFINNSSSTNNNNSNPFEKISRYSLPQLQHAKSMPSSKLKNNHPVMHSEIPSNNTQIRTPIHAVDKSIHATLTNQTSAATAAVASMFNTSNQNNNYNQNASTSFKNVFSSTFTGGSLRNIPAATGAINPCETDETPSAGTVSAASTKQQINIDEFEELEIERIVTGTTAASGSSRQIVAPGLAAGSGSAVPRIFKPLEIDNTTYVSRFNKHPLRFPDNPAQQNNQRTKKDRSNLCKTTVALTTGNDNKSNPMPLKIEIVKSTHQQRFFVFEKLKHQSQQQQQLQYQQQQQQLQQQQGHRAIASEENRVMISPGAMNFAARLRKTHQLIKPFNEAFFQAMFTPNANITSSTSSTKNKSPEPKPTDLLAASTSSNVAATTIQQQQISGQQSRRQITNPLQESNLISKSKKAVCKRSNSSVISMHKSGITTESMMNETEMDIQQNKSNLNSTSNYLNSQITSSDRRIVVKSSINWKSSSTSQSASSSHSSNNAGVGNQSALIPALDRESIALGESRFMKPRGGLGLGLGLGFASNQEGLSGGGAGAARTFSPQKQYITNQGMMKALPELSAKCWGIFDGYTGDIIAGKNYLVQAEIASLTKIMTCYVVLRYFEARPSLDWTRVFFEVSKAAESAIGTSAKLERGHQLNVRDLLYGLMLPSGNDAAIALSEGLGYLMLKQSMQLEQKQSQQQQATGTSTSIVSSSTNAGNVVGSSDSLQFQSSSMSGEGAKNVIRVKKLEKKSVGGIGACSNMFIKEMNRQARLVGMDRTIFASVHGLPNRMNVSCAKDIGLLSSVAMTIPKFAGIVKTQDYTSESAIDIEERHLKYQYMWQNTNAMLERKGYDGLKTGITDSAGPCLTSSYRIVRNDKNVHLIAVLINCKSIDARWVETKQIVGWVLRSFFPKKSESAHE